MHHKNPVGNSVIDIESYCHVRDAAEKGNATDIYEYGNIFYFGLFGIRVDKKAAFSLYAQAAKKGHDYARLMVSLCRMTGCGCDIDYVRAAKGFKCLCDKGWDECWAWLGLCYAKTGHSKKADAVLRKAQKFAKS